MKTGANSSDQKLILSMHKAGAKMEEIVKATGCEVKTIRSFIAAGVTNSEANRKAENSKKAPGKSATPGKGPVVPGKGPGSKEDDKDDEDDDNKDPK